MKKQKDFIYQSFVTFIYYIFILLQLVNRNNAESWKQESGWSKDTPSGIGKLNALDVICGKDHMTVRAEFNGPFQGIVFSKGTYGQDNCVYIKPYSSLTHATFKVKYDECGTKPDLQGKYYENTIVIQYGADIIEAWDEAKRLRCEWFEAYEKPATFRPAIPVADLDVVEMNFQGDDIDCWMEIQEGKGPWGREVSRIVPVGQPMTIVIAINDFNGQFDMRVKSCFAHDGQREPIHLTDQYGCVMRKKMLTPFKKVRDSTGRATLISYSNFFAFKFPDSMNVQIQCTVEVCRHGCPEACQKGPYPNAQDNREIKTRVTVGINNLKPTKQPINHDNENEADDSRPESEMDGIESRPYFDIKRLPVISNKSEHNHQISHASPFETYPPDQVTEASRPMVKVVDMNVPQTAPSPSPLSASLASSLLDKLPAITEKNPNGLLPEDIMHASKFLKDLGLNLDFKNIDSSLIIDKIQNNPDISQLLSNDKIRDYAIASGLKLNPSEILSETQLSHQANDHNVKGKNKDNDNNNDNKDDNDSKQANVKYKASNDQTVDTSNPTHNEDAAAIEESSHLTSFPSNHDTDKGQLLNQTSHPELTAKPVFYPTIHSNIPTEEIIDEFIKQQQHQQLHDQHQLLHKQHHELHKQHQQLHQIHKQKQLQHQQQFHQLPGEPIVQVLNIPLQFGLPNMHFPNNFLQQQMPKPPPEKPSKQNIFSSVLNHFPKLNLPFFKSSSQPGPDQLIAQANSRHPVIKIPPHLPPKIHDTHRVKFPHGPRSMRLRRTVNEPILSVHKQFQVVTSIDLAFLPNITTDSTPIFSGRREEIITGVCLPVSGLFIGVSVAFSIIFFALIFSIYTIRRIKRIKSVN